jgi:hypothetical protein
VGPLGCATVPQCHTLLPVNARLRRLAVGFVWLLAAIVLGLGGAGVVARGDNFAGDVARPELTWRYDQAMAPGIAAASDEGRHIGEATDKLADAARSALVHLLAGQTKEVAVDLSRGEVWAADITQRGPAVEARIAELPYLDSPQLVSSHTREGIQALRDIVEATRPLPERWHQLAVATVPAVEVTAVLQAHDATVFEATQKGVHEQYKEALAILDQAAVDLDQAAAMRDQLSAAVDVTTLTQWIDRNRAHDTALRGVYEAIPGGDAEKIAAAVQKQREAEAQLPPDTRALVVILGDIALGGVNQAAITIETVRGTVGIAVATLD